MNVIIFEHPRHGKIVKAFYKGESNETIEGFKRALRSENKAYRHHFIPVNGSRLVDEWKPLAVTYETYTPNPNRRDLEITNDNI